MLNTKEIGNKIAEARKKRNISQAQLAENLFISSQAVGKWERGESMPDIITFSRMAEILGVDLNYFTDLSVSEKLIATIDINSETEVTRIGQASEKRPLWDMSFGNWEDADFSGLKNLHERFRNSNMQRCQFVGSEMSGLLLKGNNVEKCDFSGSNLSGSKIQNSNLQNNIYVDSSWHNAEIIGSNIEECNFSKAFLNESRFTRSNIYGCNFTGANLSGVLFKSGGLSGVKSSDILKNTIENAVWNRTSFVDIQITDLVFTGSMEHCYFENCNFTRVVFQDVILTDSFFKNNKLKRIRFVNCKADKLSYAFLKSGKADLSGITLME